jgi:hypothetical protein
LKLRGGLGANPTLALQHLNVMAWRERHFVAAESNRPVLIPAC